MLRIISQLPLKAKASLPKHDPNVFLGDEAPGELQGPKNKPIKESERY